MCETPEIKNLKDFPHTYTGGFILETKIRKKRKAFVNSQDCVACGCCVKVCPKQAISIWKGILAKVNPETCIGCGKCAKECPASVIAIKEVQP